MKNELYRDRFLGAGELVKELHQTYAYVDGAFVKGDDAVVSVYDHGYLYGDSVFEGLRAYQGRIFKLAAHVDRLFDSAKAIGLAPPLSRAEMAEVIVETYRINGMRENHGRVIVSRGIGLPGLDPKKCRAPSVVVFPSIAPTYATKAIRLMTSSVRRKGPSSVDPRVKCSNYMDNILARMEAHIAGADDAVMLDSQGCIAEATAANVFAVKRGVLSTPHCMAALEGITRATIIDLARAHGIEVVERSMTPYDLYVADEVFLTGTAAELTPAREIDGRIVGSGSLGPITARLRELYEKCVTSDGDDNVAIFPAIVPESHRI